MYRELVKSKNQKNAHLEKRIGELDILLEDIKWTEWVIRSNVIQRISIQDNFWEQWLLTIPRIKTSSKNAECSVWLTQFSNLSKSRISDSKTVSGFGGDVVS